MSARLKRRLQFVLPGHTVRRTSAQAVMCENPAARKKFRDIQSGSTPAAWARQSSLFRGLPPGKFLEISGLEPSLQELVKTRASQMNGCAYCIDMHTKDACAAGETEQRLYALSAWQETSFYTPRERAALAWTEAITNIQQGHAPDDLYEEVRKEFSEAELVKLTLVITQINAWNRISIAFRVEPGTYQPQGQRRS
jgi:AhpD family alkylhydroperoxidase